MILDNDLSEKVYEKNIDNDFITSCDYQNGVLLISFLQGLVVAYRVNDMELIELNQK
jgi:hypothetical protein